MKKILIASSMILLVASSAFGAALATNTATTEAAKVYGGVDATAASNAPTPLVKFSTGVAGIVNFTGTTGYLIAAKHTTGSKMFATTNDVNNIYWKQAAATILTPTMLGISSPASTNLVGSGWTSY